MAGIDEVLERLVTDPEFRARLAANPVEALSGYMLYDEDLEVLAATLSEDRGATGAVEQRTSKTTLAGLLAAFEGTMGGAADAGTGTHRPSSAHVAISLGDGRTTPDDPGSGGEHAGHFDGKLLRAEDLTSESGSARAGATSESGFEIQIATSDLQNAESVPHADGSPDAGEPVDDLVTEEPDPEPVSPDGHEDEIEVYGVDYSMAPPPERGAGEDLRARD